MSLRCCMIGFTPVPEGTSVYMHVQGTDMVGLHCMAIASSMAGCCQDKSTSVCDYESINTLVQSWCSTTV